MKRQQYPQEQIDAVLAEKAKHRHSHEAWSAYIRGLNAGPTMDILVYETEVSPGYEHTLHRVWMAPVSDDLAEAMNRCLAGIVEHIEFTEADSDPLTIEVTVLSAETVPMDEVYTGTGRHVREPDDNDCCARTERPDEDTTFNACRAHALCLAILDMYSPSEEELAAGSRAE